MYSQDISDSQIEAIAIVDSMSEADFKLLLSDLEAVEMSADPNTIAAQLIDPALNGKRPAQQTVDLTFLIINLHIYSFRQDLETVDTVKAIIETYEVLTEGLTKPNIKKVEKRLNELITCYPLWFCAHAQMAMDKRERVFTGSQFQTSMTPVEIDTDSDKSDLSKQAITGLVNSMLTISYNDGGKEKSLSLYLDQYSIASLSANLDELKREAETLQVVLSTSDIETVVV
ncbi:MAG: hypothetical protein K8F91_06320 [Candidatus Obscuribacterales bacterium]|nr:hypothetical protein [Candidatus Obscuribacterales bacterium]